MERRGSAGGEGRAPPERDPGASRETRCSQAVGWALSADLTVVNFLDVNPFLCSVSKILPTVTFPVRVTAPFALFRLRIA